MSASRSPEDAAGGAGRRLLLWGIGTIACALVGVGVAVLTGHDVIKPPQDDASARAEAPRAEAPGVEEDVVPLAPSAEGSVEPVADSRGTAQLAGDSRALDVGPPADPDAPYVGGERDGAVFDVGPPLTPADFTTAELGAEPLYVGELADPAEAAQYTGTAEQRDVGVFLDPDAAPTSSNAVPLDIGEALDPDE